MRPALLLVTCLLVTSACGSSRGAVIGRPTAFPSFPTQASAQGVWAEATFYTNHAGVFGTDLTRSGILPVALRVGVRGVDETPYRLADDFDPQLYLQDGVALRWLPVESIETKNTEVSNRIAELAFRPSLLEPWDESPTAFLFFAFDEDDVTVDEALALSRAGGELYHEVDLLQSLLSFTVTGAGEPSRLHLGLRGGRWAR